MHFSLDKAINGTVVKRTCYYINGFTKNYVFCVFMSLHKKMYVKVSVNEAAAQICRLVPAMLTRRDELFPLARQVVRDSGYQYSKGHSRYI